MNIASIKLADCANGPGLRTSVFVSGCTRHCKGCFNEVAWDFDYGRPLDAETREYILGSLIPEEVDGLSILGGEPMEKVNQGAVFTLVLMAKELGKTVWLYTGHTFEELIDKQSGVFSFFTMPILRMVDVLVDGPFIEIQKDISLRFRGSRNQKIIDVQKSLVAGEVILWEEKE